MNPIKTITVAACALLLGSKAFAESNVDSSLPAYEVQSGISGNLNSIGSDALNNLMTFWAEDFKKLYPNVNIHIEGKDSSTAIPALIDGASQLGPMSHTASKEEIAAFSQKYGVNPFRAPVAIAALAIWVNKDNPIKQLTLEQADAIFSSTRKRKGAAVTTWGDLGLTGEWASRPISKYGRNSASGGTYGIFKERVLLKGDYAGDVKEQPSSASVLQSVEKELGGVGYGEISYKTAGVRAVPIVDKSGKAWEADYANAASFKYPINGFLFIFVNKPKSGGLPPLVREFLLFVSSKQGQEIAEKDGFFPMSKAQIKEHRADIISESKR